MIKKMMTWLEDRNRRFSRSFGKDISTPKGRFWGNVHYNVVDHAFLRVLWTNFFEIAPGVYRSNHPGPRRLKRYRELGIKTVVTLRGEDHIVASCVLAKDVALTLICGKRTLTLKPSDLEAYLGTRATRGSKLPRGFQRVEAMVGGGE